MFGKSFFRRLVPVLLSDKLKSFYLRFCVYKSFSQNGEDRIIAHILSSLDICHLTYLDLGANDPVKLNNTFLFYNKRNKGVLVEADPRLIRKLNKIRPSDVILNMGVVADIEVTSMDFFQLSNDTLSTFSEKEAMEYIKKMPDLKLIDKIRIPVITVEEIIKKYFDGKAPVLISLDIEGFDMVVLKSINFEIYRPAILIVENVVFYPWLSIPEKDEEMISYMKSNDYLEYAYTGVNSIFVDRRLLKQSVR